MGRQGSVCAWILRHKAGSHRSPGARHPATQPSGKGRGASFSAATAPTLSTCAVARHSSGCPAPPPPPPPACPDPPIRLSSLRHSSICEGATKRVGEQRTGAGGVRPIEGMGKPGRGRLFRREWQRRATSGWFGESVTAGPPTGAGVFVVERRPDPPRACFRGKQGAVGLCSRIPQPSGEVFA